MEIIPAIDLLDGACVRLHQGDYDQVTRFSDDPVAQARSWQSPGSHPAASGGSRRGPAWRAGERCGGAGHHRQPLTSPCSWAAVCGRWNVPKDLLACGLDRVILGTVAIEQPQLVTGAGRNVIPVGSSLASMRSDGRVATRGWIEQSDVLATELAQAVE